jgi:hypothetical protein
LIECTYRWKIIENYRGDSGKGMISRNIKYSLPVEGIK